MSPQPLSPIGSSVPSGRVDLVVWARALGVRSGDEVWDHVIKTSADIARVLDSLSNVLHRVGEYPDDDIRTDLARALQLTENAGQELLRVARATYDR